MNTELLRIIAYAINTLFMNILVYAWMKKAYGVHRSKTYMAISYVATSMVFILVTQFNIPIVNFIYDDSAFL